MFLYNLIVTIYIIGRQPTYSLEISSIKVRNSVVLSRNLFVINRRVALVTMYNKAVRRCSRIKYIFYYFLNKLSQIIT